MILAIEQHDWLEGARTPEYPVLEIVAVAVIVAAIAAIVWHVLRKIAR
jgi:hypothetical protein